MKKNELQEWEADWQRELRQRRIALMIYIVLIIVGMLVVFTSTTQAARWTRIPIIIPLVPWIGGPHLTISVPVPW